ncbi:MAG TPA: hypothetical protein DCW68_05180 [Rhodospirillaceae bacterium]|nr:hypothetical protein [Rhodospirillaceae bacterium]
MLNEKEAASYLRHSIRALQKWRLNGGGPIFVKISRRSIRYRRRDLRAWVEARLRQDTTHTSPPMDHLSGSDDGAAPDGRSRRCRGMVVRAD